MNFLKFAVLIILNLCVSQTFPQILRGIEDNSKPITSIKVGAEKTEEYLPLLKGKTVGVVGNHSSTINNTHLVDSLLKLGVNVKKVFCPEHGFRGMVDAGKKVKTAIDEKTNLPIISLYGKTKKPTAQMLEDLDILIFDIQDVGVRFYTYLSTLHYVMEACAENNKTLIVLDRPNPNGYFIDGPVMEDTYKSFLGLHPVPIVYGLTIGEYANMINEEGWLNNHVKCNLKIITLQGYTHSDLIQLNVNPSPNLTTMTAIYLYPSLGLFEGTVVSVGRGTDLPFQVIGHPTLKNTTPPGAKQSFTFKPESRPGAKDPKYKGKVCYGYNLTEFGNRYIKNLKQIYLFWLIQAYKNTPDQTTFFDENFNYHAGNATLQQQIKNGVSEPEIRASWQDGIKKFKIIRKKYLLYSDFE